MLTASCASASPNPIPRIRPFTFHSAGPIGMAGGCVGFAAWSVAIVRDPPASPLASDRSCEAHASTVSLQRPSKSVTAHFNVQRE